MKRFRVLFAAAVLSAAALAITVAMPGTAAPPTTNSVGNPISCGIIQITRGEGGGNAVGTEIGTALGLRRENEDRAAHYRSGTIDLFYLDKVDFFFNQSAP